MGYLNGLLLGLSTGVFCFSYCAPIYLPQILGEKDKRRGWTVFIKFNFGRLLAYIAFGALFGYLGLNRYGRFLSDFSSWIIIILALFLIIYGLGFSLPTIRPKSVASWCALGRKIKLPFLSGVLVGINICPPFLIALLNNFQTGGVLNGIIFFVMFYIGTTFYLIPITFLGGLAKHQWIRQGARIAAIVVGVVLIVQNIL